MARWASLPITEKTLLISLFFLFKDNHPAKVECKTTTFRWVWPGMCLVQSDCRILWSTITLEGINSWYHRFLYEDIHQGKLTCETTTFWLVQPRCASGAVRFNDSLIINTSGRNQLTSLTDHCYLSFFFIFVSLHF